MSIFSKLGTDGLEETKDRLGGGNFGAVESDLYILTLKAAYAGTSAGGATSVTLVGELEDGREYRETVYVTNKAGQNWFPHKDDPKKKVPLPGFTVIDDLCLVVTGQPLREQDEHVEEKVIKVYDHDAKAEVPKAVPMLMSLVGQKVAFGIIKQIVNKREKKGDEYVEIADTREENYIDKVFHPEAKMTVAEARMGQTEPAFWDAWVARNKGVTKDKRTIKDGEGGATGAPKAGGFGAKPGTPPQAGAQAPARQSLFGKK